MRLLSAQRKLSDQILKKAPHVFAAHTLPLILFYVQLFCTHSLNSTTIVDAFFDPLGKIHRYSWTSEVHIARHLRIHSFQDSASVAEINARKNAGAIPGQRIRKSITVAMCFKNNLKWERCGHYTVVTEACQDARRRNPPTLCTNVHAPKATMISSGSGFCPDQTKHPGQKASSPTHVPTYG
ncbi:hypothetical protein AC578_5126 [Pseudocercospora eumusae]|uniref:Uncharacterized protein n=1 Tax=Pseudocercospora eumusae TaxID=321146 RepID=A0A139HMF2_9PEZI|nr:hypothetical protein AC578_5126 [Pseudocercospora eumusae]